MTRRDLPQPNTSTSAQPLSNGEHSEISDKEAVVRTVGSISDVAAFGNVQVHVGITLIGVSAAEANLIKIRTPNVTRVSHFGTGSLSIGLRFEKGGENSGLSVGPRLKRVE